MPRLTRSSNAGASSSKDTLDIKSSDLVKSDEGGGLEGHISAIRNGMRKHRQEIKLLENRNAQLEAEIEKLHDSANTSIQPRRGRSGGPTNAGLQAQVKRLKGEVEALKKDRAKDKKKIQRLQIKEVEADMKELHDEQVNGVTDVSNQMRKLLRRFQDIILSGALEDKEECTICLETMEVNGCSSLSCQHIFCNDCLSRLEPGSVEVTCPQCREKCAREEFEVVKFSTGEQWDQLLEVANDFARIDIRGEQEISEEEDEEPFIDDKDPDASSTASEFQTAPAARNSMSLDPDPVPAEAIIPDSTSDDGVPQFVYSRASASEKRKWLAQMADQRRKRRRD